MHARELAFEVCAFVREPVPFFGSEIAAPVANFDISLEKRGVDEGFSEFVAGAGILRRACGDVFIGPVGEC